MIVRATSVVVLLLLVAGRAWADPAEDASARFRDGVRLFRASDFSRARAAFEEAYAILPNALVLGNIAACFAREGKPADAVTAYRRFLRDGGERIPGPARDEANREMARLFSHIGQLILSAEPAGAEVVVDGASAGSVPLPWPIPLLPGRHEVGVRAEGFDPFTRTLDVEAGRELNLAVALARIGSAASGPTTSLRVVRVEVPVPARPTSPPLGRGPLVWAGLGLTGVLAIGAAVTGLLALGQEGEYAEPGTTLERRRELYDSMNTLATITDVFIDAAIAVAAGTAVLYLFAGPRREDVGPTVALGRGLEWAF